MSDFELPYFVGEVQKLESCGVSTEGLRHSIDGLKAIVHMHILTIEQFTAVRGDLSILAVSHEEAMALMTTEEWSVNPPDII